MRVGIGRGVGDDPVQGRVEVGPSQQQAQVGRAVRGVLLGTVPTTGSADRDGRSGGGHVPDAPLELVDQLGERRCRLAELAAVEASLGVTQP